MPDEPTPLMAFISALRTRPEDGANLLVSTACAPCSGTGTDPVKAGCLLPGVTRLEELRCGECGGSGREDRWAAMEDVADFAIATMAERLPRIIASLKEEAVRGIMES